MYGSKRHVFAPTPCVGVVHIYVGVRESRSWEHDKSLNKGQQDLTKLNAEKSSIYIWAFKLVTLDMALVGNCISLRSMLFEF